MEIHIRQAVEVSTKAKSHEKTSMFFCQLIVSWLVINYPRTVNLSEKAEEILAGSVTTTVKHLLEIMIWCA